MSAKSTQMLPAATDGVTLHQLDDAAVVLDAGRQMLFEINAPLAYVFCCVDEGMQHAGAVAAYADALGKDAGVAEAEVTDALRRLEELGLVAGATPESAPAITAPAAERPRLPAIVKVACKAHYRVLDSIFDVDFPSDALRDAADSVLAPFRADDAQHDDLSKVGVTVGPDTAGGLALSADGEPYEGCESVDAFAPQLKALMLSAAANAFGFDAYFHTAVLRLSEGVALLPGASGSGKTCLALALARAGFDCLSDEAALLDLANQHVRAVALPACVKSPAWTVMQPLYPELATIRAHRRIDDKTVKYVTPPGGRPVDAAAESWQVRAVVFPRYAAGVETRLVPLRRIDALRRLLDDCHASRLQLTPESVDALIAWIGQTDCFALQFSSLDQAVALFRERYGPPGPHRAS